MARSDPQIFKTSSETGEFRLENVELQRIFETDKSGLTSIDVRIGADVIAPAGAYVSATIDVVFCLFQGDGQVGSCEARGIAFGGEGERDRVRIESDVARLGLDADITTIEVYADRTMIVHAEGKLRLERA